MVYLGGYGCDVRDVRETVHLTKDRMGHRTKNKFKKQKRIFSFARETECGAFKERRSQLERSYLPCSFSLYLFLSLCFFFLFMFLFMFLFIVRGGEEAA